MVEYRVLSTFVSRRLNTDLKDFTFDLWKKRGTMKTVKICSGNIDLREVNIDLKEVNIGLREVNIEGGSFYSTTFVSYVLYWHNRTHAKLICKHNLKLTILQELF